MQEVQSSIGAQQIIYGFSVLAIASFGMVVFRILVRRDYLKKGGLSPTTALIQAFIFFAFGGLPIIYLPDDWPAIHLNLALKIPGLILLIIGLGSLLYGMMRLGILRSMGLDQSELKSRGIYRKSRNPQALACGLYAIGFALLWPSFYAVGWVFLYGFLIHMMILTEEEHLNLKFGDDYRNYCQAVPRYFRAIN